MKSDELNSKTRLLMKILEWKESPSRSLVLSPWLFAWLSTFECDGGQLSELVKIFVLALLELIFQVVCFQQHLQKQ